MKYDDFINSPSGKLVPTLHNEQAFLPNLLPPAIDMGKIALDLANAMVAIGELRGACRRLPNPYLLIRPLQRLEAQTSSAMEGTFTTADELVLSEAGIGKEQKSEAREVANYIRALTWAVGELENLPLSSRLLSGAHKRLLAGVGRDRGQQKRPGEFKRDQNMIGGYKLKNARFIPPPPTETENAMFELEKYLNRLDKEAASDLIDMALAHYQLETIHPFADGNGRIGRMLVSLMAITENLLEMPVLYLSPELEGRKDEYIDLMYQVSSTGAWEDWIRFFLEIIGKSCHRAVKTIDRVLELQVDFRTEASEVSRSNNILRVVDMLFENPVINPAIIVKEIGITDATARSLLRQLSQVGILHEMSIYHPTIWIAPGVINISTPEND